MRATLHLQPQFSHVIRLIQWEIQRLKRPQKKQHCLHLFKTAQPHFYMQINAKVVSVKELCHQVTIQVSRLKIIQCNQDTQTPLLWHWSKRTSLSFFVAVLIEIGNCVNIKMHNREAIMTEWLCLLYCACFPPMFNLIKTPSFYVVYEKNLTIKIQEMFISSQFVNEQHIHQSNSHVWKTESIYILIQTNTNKF